MCIREALKEVDPIDGIVTLISGACPTGADRIAEEEALELGWNVKLYPADWGSHSPSCPSEDPGNGTCWRGRTNSKGEPHCKRAGFRRNAEMIALNPDVVLAFIHNGSNGATMTANLAVKAGIELIKYEI